MSGNIKYWSCVLTERQAEAVAQAFCRTLQFILNNSSSTYEALGWLSESDQTTVGLWNEGSPATMNNCLHDMFSEQVKARPGATAICSWDGELKYSELDELSDQLGGQLIKLGVERGSLVPLCFEKSIWAVVAILAVLKAGGSYVPMVPDHPDARITSLLEDTGAGLVLVSETQESRFARLAVTPHLAVSPAVMSSLNSPETQDEKPSWPSSQPSDVAIVIFTSGSTGRPKGILLEHRALCTSISAHGKALQVTPASRVLQFAAFTFDISLQDIFTTLAHGGCVCMPSEHDRLNDLTGAINRMEVNWAGLTPTVAALLRPDAVPTLKTLVLAGEAVTEQVIKLWCPVVDLHNCYGPAESSIYCAWQSQLGHAQRHPANIGWGMAANLWVADSADYKSPAPVGAVGELLVQGPTLARGYLNLNDLTATAFVDLPPWVASIRHEGDRVYRTGDLVRYTADGSLIYCGRKDGQIKV